ncbi:hypothetical protein OC835_004262 [Tilletia horrida]|nr:hypothetical protein OC835_004262 [Tilletia horrida]
MVVANVFPARHNPDPTAMRRLSTSSDMQKRGNMKGRRPALHKTLHRVAQLYKAKAHHVASPLDVSGEGNGRLVILAIPANALKDVQVGATEAAIRERAKTVMPQQSSDLSEDAVHLAGVARRGCQETAAEQQGLRGHPAPALAQLLRRGRRFNRFAEIIALLADGATLSQIFAPPPQ